MSNFYFALPTIPELARGLVNIATTVSAATPSHPNVSARITTNVPQFLYNYQGRADALANDAGLAAFLAKCASHPSVECINAHIEWQPPNPQNNQQQLHIDYTVDSRLTGQITLSSQNGDMGLTVVTALESAFAVTSYKNSLAGQSVNEKRAIELRQASVDDLKQQVVQLGKVLSDITEREALTRSEQQRRLEDDFRVRREEVDAEHRALRATLDAEHRTRMISIEEREKKHAEELAAFETRESKLVRRKSAEEFEKLLKAQEQVSISPDTTKKRRVVHWTIFAAVAINLCVMAMFGNEIMRSTNVDWRYMVGFSLSSSSLIATVVYYLKWNDQWFKKHADSEFQTKRNRADMIRATWIAELVSEWRREHESAVPDALISSFTRNLFAYETMGDTSHPFEDLAKVLEKKDIEISDKGAKVSSSK